MAQIYFIDKMTVLPFVAYVSFFFIDWCLALVRQLYMNARRNTTRRAKCNSFFVVVIVVDFIGFIIKFVRPIRISYTVHGSDALSADKLFRQQIWMVCTFCDLGVRCHHQVNAFFFIWLYREIGFLHILTRLIVKIQ